MIAHGVVLDVRNLAIAYDLRISKRPTLARALTQFLHRQPPIEFFAVRDVSLQLRQGEALGVLGRNGSGKSTLLLALAGLMEPSGGAIWRRPGLTTTLLSLGVGFEPELTGRENVYLAGAILGFSRQIMRRRMRGIIDFAELGAFIDAPLNQYSSGMRSRLGFAIATQVEPDVLLLDEVLGVGDIGFQDKSRGRMQEMIDNAGSIVVVTHSTNFICETCSRAVWIDDGRIAAEGDPYEVSREYMDFMQGQRGPVRSVG